MPSVAVCPNLFGELIILFDHTTLLLLLNALGTKEKETNSRFIPLVLHKFVSHWDHLLGSVVVKKKIRRKEHYQSNL